MSPSPFLATSKVSSVSAGVKALPGPDLLRSLSEDHLHLCYQPRLNVASGELDSVEALVRWEHPDHGHIAPDRFIGEAEQSGHIAELGDWVMWHALRQASRWQSNPLMKSVQVAVNVSVMQIERPGFVDTLLNFSRLAGVAIDAVELEITESAEIRNPAKISRDLHLLRELGVTIALDDFGSGIRSISDLRFIPANVFKVDRLFVADLETSSRTRAVVASIVAMAKNLDAACVLEGIETKAQYDLAVDLGFDQVQGFYVGRPMRPELLVDYIASPAFVGANSIGRFALG